MENTRALMAMDQMQNYQHQYPLVTSMLLDEMVQRICSVGDPTEIVLFGSRARGDNRNDSDVDLLVIEKDEQLLKEKQKTYLEAIRGTYPELTLLVHSRQDVEQWKYVPAYITTQALAQGKVLYRDSKQPGTTFSICTTNNVSSVAEEHSRYKVAYDLALLWFAKADDDLAIAQDALEKEQYYDAICFHAQQAAEKYMKGFLALHNKVVGKTHDLEQLAGHCQKLIDLPDLSEIELASMTRLAIEARYELDFTATQEEAKTALRKAKQLKEIILSYVEPKNR